MSCLNDVLAFPVDLDQMIKDGICFGNGTKRPKDRDEFIKDYTNNSIEEIIKKWVQPRRYWKNYIYYHLPLFFRNKLKHIIGV